MLEKSFYFFFLSIYIIGKWNIVLLMASKLIENRTEKDLTTKQKKFLKLLVKNWGSISQVEAAQKAGYGKLIDLPQLLPLKCLIQILIHI